MFRKNIIILTQKKHYYVVHIKNICIFAASKFSTNFREYELNLLQPWTKRKTAH